ncbi:uncharacterized protein LOC110984804 [Acanthaster planci]|uniref:gamma-glutamylcyclotransferase n=1 Tax=Acanthaster planci TaxID=133434 RepID=A0A8B7Z7U7_ACAPL|nr:uncharacterized protein LOC110984804 [Acanthaster planci]
MQAVMSIEEVTNVIPSTITWREPVEVSQVRGVDAGTSRAAVDSPRGRESPAHSGHLSDGDTPALAKLASRTRFYSGSSQGHGYGGLASSSSSPNLTLRDHDQANTFTETTQIIGIQAKLQEKPFSGGCVSESVMMPSVTDGVSPGSPQVSRQTIRSRARPRRPDEPAPFLSVDNLPVDKVIVEGKPHSKSRLPSDSPRKPTTAGKKRPDPLLNGTGRKTRSPPQSAFTSPVPRSPSRGQSRGTPSATSYNYNSFFTHKSSAFLAGPPDLWSMGNKYWPQHGTPNDRQKLAPLPQSVAAEALAPKPNVHVSQPFKHDVNAEVPLDRPVSPSQDLKERSIYALREVTRGLNRQQSPPQSRRGGRLLKGRLKPLHTFKLSGPTIDNCKGIQPEEMDHGPSESRMLQRKRELLSMLPADIFQPRPMTGESVHRTSIVSQLSTDRDKHLEDELGKTEEGTEDETCKLSQVLSGVRKPPNSLASLSGDNVSYLQDALTSHMEIPGVPYNRDAASEHQHEDKESQDDQSRVPQISEAYATSYESGSKIDLSSQQVEEEVTASGDAPASEDKIPEEKVEDEKESAVKDEVKATMSDYMNEGGAARVLSDMVQRVTNSAKKSTVEEDNALDQKYDTYFADTETRSDTPTSRTGSSTLMRRQSSMDDIEIDQASFELTDMVSEDGLGEDGSVKQAGKESNVERGSLSSLSKAKEPNEENSVTNDDTECQSREYETPTNEDFQKDISVHTNTSDNSSTDKSKEESVKDHGITASTLYKYIDSGLVENVQNSTSNSSINVDQDLTSAGDSAAELTLGETNDDGQTVNVNDKGLERNKEGKPTDTEIGSSSAKDDVKPLTIESGIQPQENGNVDPLAEQPREVGENTSNIPVAKGDFVAADPEASVDTITTIQLDGNGQKSEITSKEGPDLTVEQNQDTTGHSADTVLNDIDQESEEVNIAEVVDIADESKVITHSHECNGDRTELPDGECEKPAEEDSSKEETQGNESSGCHGNSFKKDDEDQDGNQGGQGGGGARSGGGSGSACGGGDGSDTNGVSDTGNSQGNPPSGTGTGGTQHRLNEITHTHNPAEEDCLTMQRDSYLYLESDSFQPRQDDTVSDDYEDDIPEVDEPVLFCGICGLDEDMCLCPCSTFNEKLGSLGHKQTIKSTSAVIDNNPLTSGAPQRSYSAAEGLQSTRGIKEIMYSWSQEAEIEEKSIQRHLILEYQAMIEKPGQKGFLSEALTSPRFGQGNLMLLQGTKMKCGSRQESAKRKPQAFLSEFEFRNDMSRLCNGVSEQSEQLECSMVSNDMMVDSGCWSEMQRKASPQSEESSKKQTEIMSTNGESSDCGSAYEVNLDQSRLEAETLEVVAKPLSKPRYPRDTHFPAARAPAPLCFKINAKPPSGFLYYFAYGADMNKSRMSSYIGREADHRLWGILFGFQLTFNKRGADLEAGGFPNIAFSPDSSVEGCVYLITPSELQKLDGHIGCPKFYTKAVFPVWMMNCAEPDELGVAQYCIPALMYVAQDKWTLNQEEKEQVESDYSVGQCLKGSELLTPSYVQHIASLRVH